MPAKLFLGIFVRAGGRPPPIRIGIVSRSAVSTPADLTGIFGGAGAARPAILG